MRDPQRIQRMLSLLSAYWHRYPDLRLGQIVSNLTPDAQNVFYVEDDLVEKRLRILLKILKKES